MKNVILPLFILLTFALVVALLVQERQAQAFDNRTGELTRKLIERDRLCRQHLTEIAELKSSQEELQAEVQALKDRLQAVGDSLPEQRPGAVSLPTPAEPKPGFSGMVEKMVSDLPEKAPKP